MFTPVITIARKRNGGEVLDLYVKKCKDGRVGLFGKIAFLPHLSKQTIQTLISNDVSVELPQELYDAKGNLYPFAVRRVAITPDPAVNGMQPFVRQRDTSISVPFLTLSIDTFNQEQDNMDNELFDSNDDGQEDALDTTVDTADEGIDTGGNGEGNEPTVSVKNKGSFLDSQLAKVMFDTCGIATTAAGLLGLATDYRIIPTGQSDEVMVLDYNYGYGVILNESMLPVSVNAAIKTALQGKGFKFLS